MGFVQAGVVEILTFDSFGPLKSCGMGGCLHIKKNPVGLSYGVHAVGSQ